MQEVCIIVATISPLARNAVRSMVADICNFATWSRLHYACKHKFAKTTRNLPFIYIFIYFLWILKNYLNKHGGLGGIANLANWIIANTPSSIYTTFIGVILLYAATFICSHVSSILRSSQHTEDSYVASELLRFHIGDACDLLERLPKYSENHSADTKLFAISLSYSNIRSSLVASNYIYTNSVNIAYKSYLKHAHVYNDAKHLPLRLLIGFTLILGAALTYIPSATTILNVVLFSFGAVIS